MTKKEMVLEHLRTVGSITSLEAFERYKATRLAAIVHDVNERAGRKVIASEDVHGQSYVRYVLVGECPPRAAGTAPKARAPRTRSMFADGPVGPEH